MFEFISNYQPKIFEIFGWFLDYGIGKLLTADSRRLGNSKAHGAERKA